MANRKKKIEKGKKPKWSLLAAERGMTEVSEAWKELEPRDRKALYTVLRVAYANFLIWEEKGRVDRVEKRLRKKLDGVAHSNTNIFLIYLRAALPEEEQKTLSAWATALVYADSNDVELEHFVGFVMEHGGVDGIKKTVGQRKSSNRSSKTKKRRSSR